MMPWEIYALAGAFFVVGALVWEFMNRRTK